MVEPTGSIGSTTLFVGPTRLVRRGSIALRDLLLFVPRTSLRFVVVVEMAGHLGVLMMVGMRMLGLVHHVAESGSVIPRL